MFKRIYEEHIDKVLLTALANYGSRTYITMSGGKLDKGFDRPRKAIIKAMANGANIQVHAGGYQNTILTAAILMNDSALIEPILKHCKNYFEQHQQHHKLINTADLSWGNTPLALAIKKANYRLALRLVNDFNADVNQVIGIKGLTPLHLCIASIGTHEGENQDKQDAELVMLIHSLLQHGADVNSELTLSTHDRPIDLLSLRVKPQDFLVYTPKKFKIEDYCQKKFSQLSEEKRSAEIERIKSLKIEWINLMDDYLDKPDVLNTKEIEEKLRTDITHRLRDYQLYKDFISSEYSYEEILARGENIDNYHPIQRIKCEDTVPRMLMENFSYHRDGDFKKLLAKNRNDFLDSKDGKELVSELTDVLTHARPAYT